MTDDVLPSHHDRGPRRTLIALLVTVGAVVVIALVAVLVRGGPAQYSESTPEGVVQRYVQAVLDGDVPTAIGYLVPGIGDDCERIPVGSEDVRVTLAETTERGDTARVEVLVTTVYDSGLFGGGQYQSEEVFALARSDGAWRIETSPWQFAVCAEAAL